MTKQKLQNQREVPSQKPEAIRQLMTYFANARPLKLAIQQIEAETMESSMKLKCQSFPNQHQIHTGSNMVIEVRLKEVGRNLQKKWFFIVLNVNTFSSPFSFRFGASDK